MTLLILPLGKTGQFFVLHEKLQNEYQSSPEPN